jgi:hypothetical protein
MVRGLFLPVAQPKAIKIAIKKHTFWRALIFLKVDDLNDF